MNCSGSSPDWSSVDDPHLSNSLDKADFKVSSGGDVHEAPFPPMKFKKSPDAPKRFKSAFIFFSSEQHKTIRAQMASQGVAAKTSTVAKQVSEAWKNLSADEKSKWDAMAQRDRARYEMEKTMYKGPWKVPAKKRSLKDPYAPKRPMSAYLDFSNSRRGMVKKENPDMNNGELSRLLATMWKEAPPDVRQEYIDREYQKRQAYNATMATWRKNSQDKKRRKRELREEDAIRALEKSQEEDDQEGEEEQKHSSVSDCAGVVDDEGDDDRPCQNNSVTTFGPLSLTSVPSPATALLASDGARLNNNNTTRHSRNDRVSSTSNGCAVLDSNNNMSDNEGSGNLHRKRATGPSRLR